MADSSDSTGIETTGEATFIEKQQQQSENAVTAFDNSENNGKHSKCPFVSGQEDARHAVVREEDACGAILADQQLMSVPEKNQGSIAANEQEGMQLKCSEKCALKIEVIDETAIIEPSLLGNGKFNGETDRNRKRNKRRGGKARKYRMEALKEKNGLQYSRKEMEALKFEGLEEQKKKWVEVYCGLSPLVAQEYDGLVVSDKIHLKDNDAPSIDFDPRPKFRKSANSGENCSQLADNRSENLNSEEIGGEWSQDEEEDSDEDYNSIQRPAFFVTGEPNFDSGPPQDGLEYLRRVRWETARTPKVAVAKVNKMKEQSLYMPQIPGIMKCRENLLPLKQWEDSFLADFSELRLGFSQLDLQSCSAKTPIKSQSIHEEKEATSVQTFESTFQKFDSITSPDNSSLMINDSPTLSTILKMEPAARNSMLKRRIRSIENMTTLPHDECLWLFALCAAVDCPLDADTSASLRSLLRKCATLRAAKMEADEEVAILNILVTISGRYFGQLEN